MNWLHCALGRTSKGLQAHHRENTSLQFNECVCVNVFKCISTFFNGVLFVFLSISEWRPVSSSVCLCFSGTNHCLVRYKLSLLLFSNLYFGGLFFFLISLNLFFLISFRRDSQGNSAISYIVRAASHLLDPRAPEFTASFVGRLVTTLIKKVRKTVIHVN